MNNIANAYFNQQSDQLINGIDISLYKIERSIIARYEQ